jgi:hypothetical protein
VCIIAPFCRAFVVTVAEFFLEEYTLHYLYRLGKDRKLFAALLTSDPHCEGGEY